MKVVVVTVSDRCSRGQAEDRGGPAVAAAAAERGWSIVSRELIADDRAALAGILRRFSEGDAAVDLILTTGGTGLGPRDLTPEATRDVIDKELPGFGEKMRREGEKSVKTALLSRAVCGSRGRSLIVNLPGSPRGAVESLTAIADLAEHAVAVLAGADHG